jgi:hypothetical protein
MTKENEIHLDKITEPILTASPEVREIIERVLQLEKNKLSQKSLRYINDDILRIIKEIVQ